MVELQKHDQIVFSKGAGFYSSLRIQQSLYVNWFYISSHQTEDHPTNKQALRVAERSKQDRLHRRIYIDF